MTVREVLANLYFCKDDLFVNLVVDGDYIDTAYDLDEALSTFSSVLDHEVIEQRFILDEDGNEGFEIFVD